MKKLLAGSLIAAMSTCTATAQVIDGGGSSIEVQPVTPTIFSRQGQEIRVYSAKVICGVSNPRDLTLAPGSYLTAINIHNPDPDNGVTFIKRVVEALPERALEDNIIGDVSDPVEESLGPNEAFEVDCPDASALLGDTVEGPALGGELDNLQIRNDFLKGFVVIETRGRPNQSPPLQVVGVYTVSPFGLIRDPGPSDP